MKSEKLGAIDDVHRHTRVPRRLGDALVELGLAACRNRKRAPAQVARDEAPALPIDAALGGERRDLGRRLARDDANARAGLEQEAQLLRRRLAAADDEEIAPIEREEGGKIIHGRTPLPKRTAVRRL